MPCNAVADPFSPAASAASSRTKKLRLWRPPLCCGPDGCAASGHRPIDRHRSRMGRHQDIRRSDMAQSAASPATTAAFTTAPSGRSRSRTSRRRSDPAIARATRRPTTASRPAASSSARPGPRRRAKPGPHISRSSSTTRRSRRRSRICSAGASSAYGRVVSKRRAKADRSFSPDPSVELRLAPPERRRSFGPESPPPFSLRKTESGSARPCQALGWACQSTRAVACWRSDVGRARA